MSADFNMRARAIVGIAVGGFISVSASAAIAQSIQGNHENARKQRAVGLGR